MDDALMVVCTILNHRNLSASERRVSGNVIPSWSKLRWVCHLRGWWVLSGWTDQGWLMATDAEGEKLRSGVIHYGFREEKRLGALRWKMLRGKRLMEDDSEMLAMASVWRPWCWVCLGWDRRILKLDIQPSIIRTDKTRSVFMRHINVIFSFFAYTKTHGAIERGSDM